MDKDRRILGIDPGVSGGLTLLDSQGKPVWIQKMPGSEQEINDILVGVNERGGNLSIYIEYQQPLPRTMRGGIGSFVLGRNYGFLRGCLNAHRLAFEEIRAVDWQKAVGCRTTSGMKYAERKKVIWARARQLFPREKIIKDVADSVLIAEHGRRIHSGEFRPSYKPPKKAKRPTVATDDDFPVELATDSQAHTDLPVAESRSSRRRRRLPSPFE